MQEVSHSSLAPYLCWNIHVGNSNWPPCWPSKSQQVLCQMWISGNVHHKCLCQVWIRLLTLAMKPTEDVTRSPKQGYQWPHKRTCVHQNFFLKSHIITHWKRDYIKEIFVGNTSRTPGLIMHSSIVTVNLLVFFTFIVKTWTKFHTYSSIQTCTITQVFH